MKRRDFIAASCLSGIASIGGLAAADSKDKKIKDQKPKKARRDYYELRRYHFDSEEQKKDFEKFLKNAAIPALNRKRIKPVGVFHQQDGKGPMYLLMPHKSRKTILTLLQDLISDETFVNDGNDFIEKPSSEPGYKRMESSLMLAFEGHPVLNVPTKKKSRIFQLRIYESHSVAAGQTKIEMFNSGEIDIFKKTGLHPVFFGEMIYGTQMPNLTYMLGFDNMEESKANWKKFVSSPEWKEISSIPKYANNKILCNITNIYLVPASCSQI